MDAFTKAYLTAALWAEGKEEYDIEDIAPENLAEHVRECQLFQEENAELLAEAGTPEQNGQDFWLTRNRHGAGFWDRGYPEHVSKELTNDAHAWGDAELDLLRGNIELTDDGTMDTVVRCSRCGREYRGNYDPVEEPESMDIGRLDYNEWVKGFIAEVDDEHVCGEEE